MYGNDILKDKQNAKIIRVTTGVIVKCNSPIGICYQDKTKSMNRFDYKITTYSIPEAYGQEFSRYEYFKPNGQHIYTEDCYKGHGYCYHQLQEKIAKMFNDYLNIAYRKKKTTKSKTKRKHKKSNDCGCK